MLVENLDRLSREQVLDALNQFSNIIRAGITIVTLMDRMVYNETSINNNFGQLLMSIMYMSRAHEESLTKSKRGVAVWENKRKQAAKGQSKITARCPLWLRLSKDRTKYILIPEVCHVIEIIYRKKLDGKGKGVITRELNQMDVWKPPVTSSNKTGGWREAYIQKILTTPAVIGTFQPCKRDANGRKAPASEPIPNYFPPAIDKQLFYEVQDLIRKNRGQKVDGKKNNGNSGGVSGKANNLFTHTVICGQCKNPMHFHSKGNYEYLHCDIARRKLNCTAKPIRYDEFENLFFNNFEELRTSDILPNQNEAQIQINDINRRITANEQELHELNESITNLSKSISKTTDDRQRGVLEALQIEELNQRDRIYNDTEALKQELKSLQLEALQLQKNIDTTREIYQLLQTATTEQDRVNIRLKLRLEIRKIVKSIEIYPLQEQYKPVEELEKNEVYQIMHSKHIDKVRIRFNGSKKMRVLFLKTVATK